jgi:hypothetical protein
MSNVFDVPNIISLQQKLIQDLSGNDQLMNTLSGKLGDLNTAVSTSTASIVPTLTKQDQVNAVINRERIRLEERKDAIDAADAGQRRLVDLTRNATQRNRAINNMYMVGVAALIVYLGIRFTEGMIPTLISDILMILLVSVTILTLITMYYDYTRRNNMDFDMIDLGEPSKMVGKTVGVGSGSAGAGSGAGLIESRIGGGCVKDACCPTGTTYNEKYAICVPKEPPFSVVQQGKAVSDYIYIMPGNKWELNETSNPYCGTGTSYDPKELACVAPKSGFTTMTSTSDKAKPNDPFEFSDYNLYK